MPAPSLLQEAADILAPEPVLEAWQQWRAGIALTTSEELAAHLEKNSEPLSSALETLKLEARAELNARQERWRSVARDSPSGSRRRAAQASE
ncbi:MAG TPA: hypothetical protein VFF07_10605 [Actinomycetota bacterium]|nr:hypothetical protein [Actinomycetota bacterium]